MRSRPIDLAWECLSNLVDEQVFAARLVLSNVSGRTIAPGWAVYFNTARPALADSVSPGYAIAHLNGDLFRLTAASSSSGAGWAPGQEHAVHYQARFWAIGDTDAPLGFYLVEADGRVTDLGDPEILPFARPEQLQRHADDAWPPADAAWRWRENAQLQQLPRARVERITPQPVSARFAGGTCLLAADSEIALPAGGLAGEAALLRALLAPLPRSGSAARIVLDVDPDGMDDPEAYRLDIGAGTVRIRGASAHGVFNGIQTLGQLLEADGSVPLGHVADAPRFRYRGMMLDVARHFAAKETVLRLIDCMALYKLNRLHLHLTDDEGWRLRIDALPELTDIGSRRGVASDGAALPPSFGSGADVDASPGTGFYETADFVAILRHAHARHIEVIPEFNMPGHARAAVVAMRARHDRLLAAGDADAAWEYRLDDPDDASVYESVQMWHDNVICIALPSVDRFIETVVAHVAALYREAGVPLRAIHTGGDEVPAGAWLGSPRCRALMEERGWTGVGQLHADFVGRCRAILARHGLAFAGWEENALLEGADGQAVPNPDFAGPDFHVYAWNNAWGSGKEDVAYRLANAGYEVVLANAANLYFDLAYAKDPQEPGYYWAGFVETRDAFAFCPLDMAAGEAARDPMGRPVPAARLAALERLGAAGRAHIAGLQGELWAENACSPARLEYLVMPRMIALAERAWAPEPGWSAIADPAARSAAMQADWNAFANRLGQRELPRLDRPPLAWDYRLPPPGAVRAGDVVRANVALPGLALHYTLDGSAPTAASPRVGAAGEVAPVPRDRVFKVAAFDTRGRGSRIVTLEPTSLDAHGQGTR
ncbi:family 20 glycosylhydrolase [Massilia sp. YIM B02763]|uniref:family 20 glycosylhydrolase n=1 Tax=Massilia sp. YIM B02763 TaxID=3050130 RepID=UPI0025B7165D|nr:family 20 glycosylhydrolase [Massilia sp. YIM B02763]